MRVHRGARLGDAPPARRRRKRRQRVVVERSRETPCGRRARARRARGSGRGSRRCTRPPTRVARSSSAAARAAAAALLPTATLPVTATTNGARAPGALGDQLGERSVDLDQVGGGDECRSATAARRRAAARAPPTRVGRTPRTAPRPVTLVPASLDRRICCPSWRQCRGPLCGVVDRWTLGSPPDRTGGDDGGTRRRDHGRRHPRRHPDRRPVRRDRRPGVDAAAGRGGRRRRRGRAARAARPSAPPPASTPGCAASAASCSTSSSPTTAPRSTTCSPPPTCWCTTTVRPVPRELGLDDATLAEHAPAAHRVVGALVAGEPRRRRPPGRRAAGAGAPRRPRRAAGLPRRPDLPPLPDRELVRVAPRRHRHRRPPDRPRAHRARRARAHEHRPGRARPDGDALAPGRAPVAVAGDRHAQGADRRHAVRVAATACGCT